MEELRLEKNNSKYLPEIHFKMDGELSIKGSIVESNIDSYFQKIIIWVKEYVKNPAPKTKLVIYADSLLSTVSAQWFIQLFIILEKVEPEIIWHFDEDDDEEYISIIVDYVNPLKCVEIKVVSTPP